MTSPKPTKHTSNPQHANETRPRAQAFATGLTVCILAGAAGFALLTFAVMGETLSRLDRSSLDAFRVARQPGHPIGPDWLPPVVRGVSFLGNYRVLLPGIPALAGLYMLFRKWKAGIYLMAVTGTSFGLSYLIKHLSGRSRPPQAYQLIQENGPSFPSAHAMVTSTLFLALGLLLARRVKSPGRQALLVSALLVLPAAIGASRVYLGVHWPTDVLAGWVGGLTWALLGWLVLGLIHSAGDNGPPFPPEGPSQ
jgi:undecaprenyl-diphosphatase